MLNDITTFLAQQNINPKDYDIVAFGDGSGTVKGNPGGWHLIIYDTLTEKVDEYSGSCSDATNNTMELSPLVNLLERYVKKPSRILLYSDSEITVRCFSGQYRRKANLDLWERVDKAMSVGSEVTLNWIPRNSNNMMKMCDAKAKNARINHKNNLNNF